MCRKERDREREAKYTRYAELPRPVNQFVNDQVTNPMTTGPFVYRDSAYLGKVFPHYVKRTTALDGAVIRTHGDTELLNVFVEIHHGLVEQAPGADVLIDQPPDNLHVPRPRLSDRIPQNCSIS